MSNPNIFSIFTIAFTAISCFAQHPQFDPSQNTPSFIKLLATPKEYDGKNIRVIGFLHLEFEGDGLWLHKEDFVNGIDTNAVNVAYNQDMAKNYDKYNNHYVIITGHFKSATGDPLDIRSGLLFNISDCHILSKPNRLRASRSKK